MPSLRDKMAEHGFESNDDYEFQLRCLLESPARGLRTLNIEGDSERRKTAFATALAGALGFPHCLYHHFTAAHPPLPDLILPPSQDGLGRQEPPIDPLDQTVSEACAQSEGDPTILILDQLQAADFREHIRIHRLHVRTTEHLRLSLFGRSESLRRDALRDPALDGPLSAVVEAAQGPAGRRAHRATRGLSALVPRDPSPQSRGKGRAPPVEPHPSERLENNVRNLMTGWGELANPSVP